MLDKAIVDKRVTDFKTKHGVQDQDEHVITTIHLMNSHRIDLSAAQDQTSHGAGDHGIDGWHYDSKTATLFIYQSKLTESKGIALKGCDGLCQAATWIGQVLATGQLGGKLSNAAVYNLARCLGSNKDNIRNVRFSLITQFNPNELLDCSELDECQRDLVKSPLNGVIADRNGRIWVEPETYNLDASLPPGFTSYYVDGTPSLSLQVRKKTQLQVVYLRLHSLVELFRRRGNRLFEKNVRLYLNTKESRVRLEHPLEDTLDRICRGELEPAIFPFFHIGVTITAGECRAEGESGYSLETPNVINGCQTINIADRYLKHLEKEKAAEKIQRFKLIPVLAKIVISGTTDDVREIANCNNRQNPIDAWQLFSNDPIHISIELAFQEAGIFYERQRGKFDAEIKSLENVRRYFRTNGTKITVEELGQLISLCRRQLQLAAKPSDVFASKEVHDTVFTSDVPERHVNDAVFSFNALKAVKNGLRNYLQAPTHANEMTHRIFVKPLVRNSLYHAAIVHLYQRCPHLLGMFGTRLNKKSPPTLATEAESFYRKVVARTKAWYQAESQQLNVDVSFKKLDAFLSQICYENNLDPDGAMPFTRNHHDWTQFVETGDGEGD